MIKRSIEEYGSIIYSPKDVEDSAGCQTSKNCSSKPQDLDIKKIQNMVKS